MRKLLLQIEKKKSKRTKEKSKTNGLDEPEGSVDSKQETDQHYLKILV